MYSRFIDSLFLVFTAEASDTPTQPFGIFESTG